jgi:apolipoprotein N-acyltransferase
MHGTDTLIAARDMAAAAPTGRSAMTRFLVRLRGWRADVAALLFGTLAAAALPPLHVIPVLLVAVPGLLLLIGASRGPAVAFRRGWWFGFGHHLVGLYWITEAILVEAARYWWFVPVAVPALSAVLALFIAAPAAVSRLARPGWPRALVLAGGWTLADLARQFVLSGFPWNPWGSVWAIPGPVGDVFIQLAALVGEPSLTLLTVLLAALPLGGRRPAAIAGALLAAWAGFGLIRLAEPLPPAQPQTVVLVQGNVNQGQKWNRSLAAGVFERYLDLTRSAVAAAGARPLVVVWPETASPYLLQTDAAARAAIAEATGGAPALVGTVRFGTDARPRNALAVIDAQGGLAGLYDKWHLVPFGEFQPDWFPFPIQIVPGGGFAPGSGPETLHPPGAPPVEAMICYEAIFPGVLVDRAHRPDWLVNVTNDAWFGNSTGPRQHLAAARFRAVELGLPLMRAANTGITAGFDARGRELGRLGMGTTGALTLSLPGPEPPTWFARFGLAIPLALALVAIACGFGIGGLGRRPTEEA